MENKGHSAEQDTSQFLDTQVLALRLLSTSLPNCQPSAPVQAAVQDRLFRLIGYSTLMCRTDGSHYGDQGLLQKVRKGRGTRVALTASPSSTIVEEAIGILRKVSVF